MKAEGEFVHFKKRHCWTAPGTFLELLYYCLNASETFLSPWNKKYKQLKKASVKDNVS